MRYRIITTVVLIAALIGSITLMQGCKKAEAKDAAASAAGQSGGVQDPATEFFVGLEETLTDNSLTSIAIIEITDPKDNDAHRVRNIRQATMEQLAHMSGIAVREVSIKRVNEVLGDLRGTASTGLNPDDVMRIGIQLGVDALLFASIESKQNDVFFWAYSTMSGEVIFSQTLKKWALATDKGLDFGIDLGNLESGTEKTATGT